MTKESLQGQLLLAMPGLTDSMFKQSICLICEHSLEQGAFGIVLNRPHDISLNQLLNQLNIDHDKNTLPAMPIFNGGPVRNEQGFILHDSALYPEDGIDVIDGIRLSHSTDILRSIAHGEVPEHCLISLSYAGWGPEQLEAEIADNAWLTVPYDPQIVFSTPAEKQWLSAGFHIGVDMNLLSTAVGHA